MTTKLEAEGFTAPSDAVVITLSRERYELLKAAIECTIEHCDYMDTPQSEESARKFDDLLTIITTQEKS